MLVYIQIVKYIINLENYWILMQDKSMHLQFQHLLKKQIVIN